MVVAAPWVTACRAVVAVTLALGAGAASPRAARAADPPAATATAAPPPGAPPGATPPATAPPAELAWCIPELTALEGDVCWAPSPATPPPPKSESKGPPPRRALVIFLHGLLEDGKAWQHPIQRGMLALARQHDFALLAPRGLNGVGPGSLPNQIAWPARVDVRAQEDELLAKIQRARLEAERREGAPYDEVFVFGFSNGAYYASSLALRGRLLEVDGYAAFAGGSARSRPSATGPARKPIFVGVASADRTTVQRSRELVRALRRAGWPHRAMEAKVGHTVADAHLRGALRYLRAQASGTDPKAPPSSSPRSPTGRPSRPAKRPAPR